MTGLPAAPACRLHGEHREADDQDSRCDFGPAPGSAGMGRASLVPRRPGRSPSRCGRTGAGGRHRADRRIPGGGGPAQAERGTAGHGLRGDRDLGGTCRCREHRPIRGRGTGRCRRRHRRAGGDDQHAGCAAQTADGSKAHHHFTANYSRCPETTHLGTACACPADRRHLQDACRETAFPCRSAGRCATGRSE